MHQAQHLTETEIMAGLEEVRKSPQDNGSLNAIGHNFCMCPSDDSA